MDHYRGVLFDLDGTLVDSLDLILNSYRHTMREHLGRVPPHEEWMHTMGRPLRVQLESFAESPEQLKAMFQTYIKHNQAHHDRLAAGEPDYRLHDIDELLKLLCVEPEDGRA